MKRSQMTPDQIAKAHGLTYYTDDQPGILRRRCGRGFTYIDAKGQRITDPMERQRLAVMAVPPAYDEVWMAPFDTCHLWATGIDDAGRKQYLYNPRWTEVQAAAKFDGLADVADALPALRRWIARQIKEPVSSRQTQTATALALIDRAALRPGNDAYASENQSYGAATLEDRHVTIEGDTVKLSFRGKGGARIRTTLHGAQLAQTVGDLIDTPGKRLFTYDAGSDTRVTLKPEHLNTTLRDVTGMDITAKDLRTWHGSLAGFAALRSGAATDAGGVAEQAADRLQNTPAVARSSYVHPKILDAAESPETLERVKALPDDGPADLRRHEAALALFLRSD